MTEIHWKKLELYWGLTMQFKFLSDEFGLQCEVHSILNDLREL